MCNNFSTWNFKSFADLWLKVFKITIVYQVNAIVHLNLLTILLQWGPCVWLKGSPRWDRSYFAQLLPGRTGCRQHVFFKLLSERWGVAFGNFYNYLREVTESEQQCKSGTFFESYIEVWKNVNTILLKYV